MGGPKRCFTSASPRRRRFYFCSAAVQGPPIERDPTFVDLRPRRQVLDLQPMAAAFGPGSFSLAKLIADRDWRKRTSETLNRLFQ